MWAFVAGRDLKLLGGIGGPTVLLKISCSLSCGLLLSFLYTQTIRAIATNAIAAIIVRTKAAGDISVDNNIHTSCGCFVVFVPEKVTQIINLWLICVADL